MGRATDIGKRKKERLRRGKERDSHQLVNTTTTYIGKRDLRRGERTRGGGMQMKNHRGKGPRNGAGPSQSGSSEGKRVTQKKGE